jgi:trigger factor
MIVKTDAAEVRPDYEEVVGYFVNNSRLPGFRPGKAPRAVVQRHYQRDIDGEVRNRLIGKFYREALAQAKINTVAVVDVTDVLFAPEIGISFAAIVDVAPDFKLPKYKKIPLKVETPSVAEDQVAAQVDRLRKMMARAEEAPAGAALVRGDLALVDYTATCDGKPLQEVCPDCANLAVANDFWAAVEEPEFIPGVALALEGAKVGDTREVKVKFEKDFQVEALRGKKTVYSVKVKQIRHRIMPEDADVCKRIGMEDMSTLREHIRKDLLAAAETRERDRQRQEVVDFLIKRTEFELPQSVVAEETNITIRGMLQDVVGRGATREDIEKNREALLGAATTASQDRVRLRYILSRIAEEEKVEIADAEVEARLKEMAAQYRMPIEKLRAKIEERHGLDALRSDIRNEKTLNQLVEDAKAK